MAEAQNPAPTPSAKKGGDGPTASEAGRAAGGAEGRTFDEGARQAKEGARAAEAVADKAADASRAATRANAEILRRQIDTAQQAARSTLEAGARSVEGWTQNITRAFGVSTPNPDLAEQSAQNIQAVAQASRALAQGAQEASRAWFDLTQRAVRTNLEAFGQLAGCRSLQEVVAVQSNLLRNNLQQAMESGEAIARASSQAIEEAGRAMQPQRGPESPRS